MLSQDFTPDSPGKTVLTAEGHPAFAPSPLPPKLHWRSEVLQALSSADRALGELASVGNMLPNPHLLIGPFMRREAILSSRIEGTYASEEELLLFEAAPQRPPKTPDVKEVANYVGALEYGLARLEALPVCLRLIREVHARLLEGVHGTDRRPGEFRTSQNYIGRPGQPIAEARYVPPPVNEMMIALDQFEKYLHTNNDLPPLVKLALVHYQFEAIHPFVDGNGRIGRLLITLLLCERQLLPKPLLYLSAYFDKNRDAYVDHLLRISQAGTWEDWILFFLTGVAEQGRDAIEKSQKLLQLRQEYRDSLQTARTSALLLQLVDELFSRLILTTRGAERLLNVTYTSAQSNIKKLVDAGILRELTGQKRNRVYCSPDILRIISAD